MSNDEQNANARMIAAAPDLLEALQEALNWCEIDAVNEDGYPTQNMFDARAERLRAAIAKAEVLPSPNPLTCNDPECDSVRFTATAEVTMNYLLDGDGDWVEDRGESETRDVDYDSLICDVCGEGATLR